MFGSHAQKAESVDVHEQLGKGLKMVLGRVKDDLRNPQFLKGFRGNSPAPIAMCEEPDCSYVLCRVPINLKARLSMRELEVAGAVRDGRPNKMIARDLGLSESTIATHLRRVYKRLGINSRLELALLAIGLWADKEGGEPTT